MLSSIMILTDDVHGKKDIAVHSIKQINITEHHYVKFTGIGSCIMCSVFISILCIPVNGSEQIPVKVNMNLSYRNKPSPLENTSLCKMHQYCTEYFWVFLYDCKWLLKYF